jgi:hypothetical protein
LGKAEQISRPFEGFAANNNKIEKQTKKVYL